MNRNTEKFLRSVIDGKDVIDSDISRTITDLNSIGSHYFTSDDYENKKETLLDSAHAFVNHYIKCDTVCNTLFLKIIEAILNNLHPNDLISAVYDLVAIIEIGLRDSERQDSITEKKCDIKYTYLIDSALSVLTRNGAKHKSVDKSNKILFSDLVIEFLVYLSVSDNKAVSFIILSSVFPKVSVISDGHIIYEKLWCVLSDGCNISFQNQSLINTTHSSVCLSKKLSVLCSLSDHYLADRPQKPAILSSDRFWLITYSGLISESLSLRKKAIYLIKRAIDCLEFYSSIQTPHFIWNIKYSCEIKNIWRDVFILLETLEEKQVHLVMPIVPSALKIFCSKYSLDGSNTVLLTENWLFCICQRILCHDSSTIVKWGLSNILASEQIDWSKLDTDFVKVVLQALNNSSLYLKQNFNHDDTCDMLSSITSWLKKTTSYDNEFKVRFFNDFIMILKDISWAPVPLFYVVEALSKVPSTNCLVVSSLEHLKLVVRNSLCTQNVYIRGAIQCLLIRVIIQLTDLRNCDNPFQVICDLLSVFKSDESLKRGTRTWFKVVDWLKNSIDRKSSKLFLDSAVKGVVDGNIPDNNGGLARIVVLCFDADILSDNDMHTLFSKLFEIFKDCYSRTYINEKALDNTLIFVSNIIKELNVASCNCNNTLKTFDLFLNAIKFYLKEIVLFIRRKLLTLSDDLSSVETLNIYLVVINSFFCIDDFMVTVKSDVLDIITDSWTNVSRSDSGYIKKYIAVRITCWCLKLDLPIKSKFGDLVVFNNERYNTFMKDLLSTGKINELTSTVASGNEKSMWKKIVCDYTKCCWTLLYFDLTSKMNLHLNFALSNDALKSMLNCGMEAVSVLGRETLVPVNRVFKILLPIMMSKKTYIESGDIIRFISVTWQSCFELRKLDLFWKVFVSWLEMVFQEIIIENDTYRIHLIQYIAEIINKSESVSRLFSALVYHVSSITTKASTLSYLTDFIVSSLTYGPIHRKDLRIENQTCLYIMRHGDKFSINSLKSLVSNFEEDSIARWKVLDLIIQLSVTDGSSNTLTCTDTGLRLLTDIIQALIKYDDTVISKKRRYFNDSLHHRIRNRILQSILVLHHAIERILLSANEDQLLQIKSLNEKIFIWSSNNISKESHQPSVRFLLEWLMIKCILMIALYDDSTYIERLWQTFLKGSEERAGSICSFISVAFHLATFLQKQLFTDRCVQEIMPWCMAQNFNIRLYSQVALLKLFELCYTNGELPLEYRTIKDGLTKSINRGTAVRNVPKLMNDFFFSTFHPVRHFSLQSLFIEVLRLTSVSPDEWMYFDETLLSKCFVYTIQYSVVPLRDNVTVEGVETSLTDCQPASYTVKTTDVGCSDHHDSDSGFVQKKFVPWRDMQILDAPDTTDTDNRIDVTTCHSSDESSTGLIVVASLIDRPPNLGGLSRTCEVFGVKQLVLNGLHHTTNKDFTSLSMSSEKHVDIIEVKIHNLKDYLLTMKRFHNYTLVGVEQTPTSIQLNEFKFPDRTILLLGNEKEGIPPNLLPLVDVCVEVPQLGIVRSLNVHVTGALFIWEYAKTHKLI